MLISEVFALAYMDHFDNEEVSIDLTCDAVAERLDSSGYIQIDEDLIDNWKLKSALYIFLTYYFNNVVFNKSFGLSRVREPFGNAFENILLNNYCKLRDKIDFSSLGAIKSSIIRIINDSIEGMPINQDKYQQFCKYQELVVALFTILSLKAHDESSDRTEFQERCMPFIKIYRELTDIKEQYLNSIKYEAAHCIKVINYLI